MDVLLINPPHRLYPPYNYALLMPPLNLTIVAAVLREHGMEPYILDMPILSIGPKDLIPLLKKWQPKVVGIANRSSYSWPIVKQIAHIVKKYVNSVKIVAGGTFVSWRPDLALEMDSPIDTVIVGETERTCPQVFRRLLLSEPLDGLLGVAFRRNGQIIQGDRAEVLDNLDELPMPANDLLPIDKYIKQKHMYLTFLGRGCPFNCEYCTSSWEKKVRYRSIDHIIKEIDQACKYGFKDFYFCDDIFCLNRGLVLQLCEYLVKQNYDISFQCMSRINNVDEEIIKAMASAGCRTIAFGYENKSNEVLDRVGRKEGSAHSQAKYVFGVCRKYNINPVLFLMFGLPYSTYEDELKSIRTATDLNPYDVRDFSFMPYPGTKMFANPQDYDIKICETNLLRWSQLDAPIHETSKLSRKAIIESRMICGALFRYGHTFSQGKRYRRYEESVLIKTTEGGFIYNSRRPEELRKTDMFLNCLELNPICFEVLLHCDGYHSIEELINIVMKVFDLSSEEATSQIELTISQGLSFGILKEMIEFVKPGFKSSILSQNEVLFPEIGV